MYGRVVRNTQRECAESCRTGLEAVVADLASNRRRLETRVAQNGYAAHQCDTDGLKHLAAKVVLRDEQKVKDKLYGTRSGLSP